MKFAIAAEHRDFFLKQHAIEFEGLLKESQLNLLDTEINAALAERLGITLEAVQNISPGKQFMAGRDLWRDNAEIKKIVLQKQFAEIAADLVEQKPIRLGYDQLFPELPGRIYKSAISDAYHQLLNTPSTLAKISSIQGVLCGLILCIKGDNSGAAEPGSVFTRIPGNGVFFQADAPLDFNYMVQHPQHRYLLIAYVRNSSLYVRNDADPHTHALKQFDYAFGEKLSVKWHPIIIR